MPGLRTAMHEVLDTAWVSDEPVNLRRGWRHAMATGNLYRVKGGLRSTVYKSNGKVRVVFHVEQDFDDEAEALAVANSVLEASRA